MIFGKRLQRTGLAAAFCTIVTTHAVLGQEAYWVQIEAQPSLVEAEERVRDYAAALGDVAGFSLGSGWYAVALGPFTSEDAARRLQTLRQQGRIPGDSYVVESSEYRQQFWPVGANLVPLQPNPSEQDNAQTQAPAETPTIQPSVEPEPAPVIVIDETPREARRSEAQLDREQRKALQIALKWAGHYTSGIDGAFGAGTRRAMASWQSANTLEPTGVLTTGQRALLLKQYNAVLESVGLERIADPQTGIEIQMPLGLVAFDAYQAPFARYTATGEPGVQVIQISQPGTQKTLYGLYEILQTLEYVPLDGPRERRRTGFSITGQNSKLISQTEVTLKDGEIKGFILVWPNGDEERRVRVLDEMRKSFARIPGVLSPQAGITEPDIDLVSGLKIRKPRRSRSGFYVNQAGNVITSAEAVENCGSLTLEGTYKARVERVDTARGLALLAPEGNLAPARVAQLSASMPQLQSEVVVAGYSFGGVLGAPSMTFGTLEDVKGLRGERHIKRLSLASLEGDGGGPVLDATGAVIGVLQPRMQDGRQLPEDTSFATRVDALRDLLNAAGVRSVDASEGNILDPVDLTAQAATYTVLVTCWD